MSFKKKFSSIVLKIIGWKVGGERPEEKKFVFLAAPHTSNWDFPLGMLTAWYLEIDLKVLMKKSWFIFPIKGLLLSIGAMPLDRSKGGTVIDGVVREFDERDAFVFSITPEGTRSYTESWKTGFYTIATRANAPIVCGYLDYGKKETGVGPIIYPQGDAEKDFGAILKFYRTVTPRYSQKFNMNPSFGKKKA